MPNIPLPQIKIGKHKERSVMCEILTDDGRWIDKELPALSSCVDDEDTGMAFLIDPENQYMADDGTFRQLLTEKSQIPLCLRKISTYQDGKDDENELKKVSDELFEVSFEQRQMEAVEQIKQSDAWDKLYKIVIIISATILIIVGIRWISGGIG